MDFLSFSILCPLRLQVCPWCPCSRLLKRRCCSAPRR
uniref:Uncharacterized protein n=1 Tax=Siphoviridae sp. ctigT3 TaxID=2826434 RepID=A0A8S5MTB1_9CAUD|nr:MAG TPA: hypothetical protein [Siphoviridae sp. ctigT3]